MQEAVNYIDHDTPSQQSLDVTYVEDMLFKLRRDGDLEEREWQELQQRADSLSMANGHHSVLAVRAARAIDTHQRELRLRVKTATRKMLPVEVREAAVVQSSEMTPELIGAA